MARAVAREFVGGPFDGEIRACDDVSVSIVIPLPEKWRAVPEWAGYRLEGEHMAFAARGPLFDVIEQTSFRKSRDAK